MMRRTQVTGAGSLLHYARRTREFGWNNEWAAPKKQMTLMDAQYGWEKDMLPRLAATTDFSRQMQVRRMLTELIRRDHVITIGARAPALRAIADHTVGLAKQGTTTARQELAHFLHDPILVDKAFDEFPRRFHDYDGSYTMQTKLRTRRRHKKWQMYFVEFKNRAMSDSHKGEDYTTGPERFFNPPLVDENEKGVVRPAHHQMVFDRWAGKFKTAEYHYWWKQRHAKLRFWGMRGVPHPADVEPLWTEKEEEEFQMEQQDAAGGDDAAYDLDEEDPALSGIGK